MINTIDFDTSDEKKTGKVLAEILKCPHLDYLGVKRSSSQHFHFVLFCGIDCTMCRQKYDDKKRFAFDKNRATYRQNVLWKRKQAIELSKMIRGGVD